MKVLALPRRRVYAERDALFLAAVELWRWYYRVMRSRGGDLARDEGPHAFARAAAYARRLQVAILDTRFYLGIPDYDWKAGREAVLREMA